MHKLSSMIEKAGLLLFSLFVTGSALAELPLNFLDKCRPVTEIIKQVKKNSAEMPSCRQPRDDLERQFLSRFARRGVKLCLLRELPSALLEPFSCLQPPRQFGATMICFRPARLSEIKAYKIHYGESEALEEQQYLNAASTCSSATGDASRISDSTFPHLLTEIAAYELGFSVLFSSGQRDSAFAVHGFGKTDPDLRGNIPSAIEFLSFTTSDKKIDADSAAKVETKKIGDWTILIDDDAALIEGFEEAANKQDLTVHLVANTFNFEKHQGERNSLDKLALLRKWNRIIVQNLRDEKFKSVSDDSLKAQTGMSKAAIFEAISKNMPYGVRKTMNINADFDFLFNERALACHPANSGAIAAYVMRLDPQVGVTSDYGSINLMLLAVGKCSNQKSVNRYMENLLAGAVNALVENLNE